MFNLGDKYFDQTKMGESRLWSWGIAIWFTIMGIVFSQNLILAPLPSIVSETNPDLYQRYMESAMALFADETKAMRMAAYMGGATLAAVLTIIFWVVNRATSSTARKITGWLTAIFAVLTFVLGGIIIPEMNDPAMAAMMNEMLGASIYSYILMLLTFPAMLVGLFLVQKFIHKRTVVSLFTYASKINWKRILFAIIVTWLVYGLLTAAMHFTGFSKVAFTFDSKRFFSYALVSLLLIPLQSGTEEIIVRGYLNQAFGHFLKNKWIVFTITSLMFASLHLANPESVSGAEQGALNHILIMSGYFLFGFILCVVVYFEGGLEAAIGVHAANNMFAAIFVNYEGSVLPTPSLFLSKAPEASDNISLVLILGAVAFILYKTRDSQDQMAAIR